MGIIHNSLRARRNRTCSSLLYVLASSYFEVRSAKMRDRPVPPILRFTGGPEKETSSVLFEISGENLLISGLNQRLFGGEFW